MDTGLLTTFGGDLPLSIPEAEPFLGWCGKRVAPRSVAEVEDVPPLRRDGDPGQGGEAEDESDIEKLQASGG